MTATGAGLVALYFFAKMGTKIVGIRPLTRAFGLTPRLGNYTTLLMATGLTFGSISALFGYTHGYIDRTQYTILVTVVILSAVVPTLFAQTFFRPRLELGEADYLAGTREGGRPRRRCRRSERSRARSTSRARRIGRGNVRAAWRGGGTMPWVAGLSVRILTHERASVGRRLVVDALLDLVRREQLAGMTVLRALDGYSYADRWTVRTTSIVGLGDDLPVVIEIVDRADRLEPLLPDFATAAPSAVLTVTEIRLHVSEASDDDQTTPSHSRWRPFLRWGKPPSSN